MSKHWHKPAVCWQTDPDEAFLVGTKESYIRLANRLLTIAQGAAQPLSRVILKRYQDLR